ncbi:hypothetical protein LZK76_24395 (plasmid) [Rhizobium leguminosarum]|nr:hypothetical protein LZK76_24395 [Rhizobium leguminosarum]
MVELSSRNARTWSRIGPRAVYGQALTALATENENIVAMSADLGRSSGLDRFSKEYPDQFLNTGIAEQNMVGCAAGLARMGFDVFASTFCALCFNAGKRTGTHEHGLYGRAGEARCTW